MDIAATASTDEAKRRRKAITATVLGNGFEWFDFMVYGFFAITIGQLFFPTGNELTSLLLSVATFGVGFLMRPVGGILIGMYSDRVGRKAALSLTIILMAVGTAMIGLAPTYEQIGIAAPIMIIFARLLQGFSAGGEMGSATAFLTEHAPASQKGYYASWIQSSIGFAVVLGALAGTILTLWLTPEELKSWGWRLPFLFGILIGPIGFYIRRGADETPAFLANKDKVKRPLSEIIHNYPRETFTTFSMVILWTVCIYVLLFYMPTYAVHTLKMPSSMSFLAAVVGGLMITILSPFAGSLSDRIGRKKILAISSGSILLLAYPMFALIVSAPTQLNLVIFQAVFGLLIAGYSGPILAAFSEIFPSKVLSTGLSVAYNVAVMTFGGFASLILTWLISTTGSAMAPAIYVAVAAFVSFVGVTFGFRERKKIP
ncbi:MFS transporter [Pseudomonas yamanorum]|uniref:MFS transporter n=1 Tax=Pseudomonas yamanorum TaxID=515393 RepID=UPI001C481C02|nr:MFS transporter [Pseudomonas yamanorum]MBV6659788.1 MFS transporter [Pseudomonas yamanorum]